MFFSEPVLFEIPVRPRIQKFIAAKLRDAQGRPQPLLVSADSEGAGLMLWAMAQSEKVMLQMGWRRARQLFTGLTDGSGRVIAPPDMTAKLGLGIAGFHKTRHQYLLNYAELEVFNNFVDCIILNELVGFCAASPETAPMLRIKQFCDRYDFAADELGEETLKKVYQRHRAQTGSFCFNERMNRLVHFQPYALVA